MRFCPWVVKREAELGEMIRPPPKKKAETVPRLDLSPRGEAKNNSCEALQLERLENEDQRLDMIENSYSISTWVFVLPQQMLFVRKSMNQMGCSLIFGGYER